LQQLTEQFIQERTYFKNVTVKTIAWYRQSFHAFDGAMDTRATIGDRIAKLRQAGVSATSVNTYLRAVNAFLRWMHNEGHMSEPIRIPKLKEEQKVLATLRPEHVQRIIQFRPKTVSQQRIHTLACLLLDTGLRIDEALSLTRDDIDLDNMLLRVRGKGAKHRLVPISMEMRKLLWKWLRRQDGPTEAYVFQSRLGSKLTQRNVLRYFKIFGTQLHITGVRFSFHTLRHTFAVNYIRNGGDVFRLQRILGHSTLEMTRRYVNLQTSDLQAVHSKLSLLSAGARRV
jgi:integrase/recombinase XerD